MVAKIGAPAPNFKAQAVVNGEIKEISLDDYKVRAGASGASCWRFGRAGRHCVIAIERSVSFYPLDFTFVCPTEIVAFSGALCTPARFCI